MFVADFFFILNFVLNNFYMLLQEQCVHIYIQIKV